MSILKEKETFSCEIFKLVFFFFQKIKTLIYGFNKFIFLLIEMKLIPLGISVRSAEPHINKSEVDIGNVLLKQISMTFVLLLLLIVFNFPENVGGNLFSVKLTDNFQFWCQVKL